MNRTLPVARRHPIAATFGLRDFLPSFAVLWQRRELLWSMTGRNIRSQYKQSILGYAWVFVNPLMQMLVLTFVFSTILRIGSDVINHPFPLFLFVALLPWMFFTNAISGGTDSVVASASLVTKVYFPRELLVMATVFSKVVDLLFGLLILFGLMVFYNESPSWTVVWVPVIFAIQLLFTIGLALPLAALNLFFHDVRYLVGVVLLVWFYITPVIYPVEMEPDRYKVLFDLNPLSLVLNAYRRERRGAGNPRPDPHTPGRAWSPPFYALRDVSFRVARGESLGIIGRNGSGKSTILKLIAGVMAPSEGEINVYGRVSPLIELGAGFHPDLTGRENVFLNASILGMSRKEVSARFDEIISFAELWDFVDTPVKRYSSGMYIRLGFSVAVHSYPEVLLVDEVLSVGDAFFQEKCLAKMHEFQGRGTTMVLVSHSMELVERFCERVLFVNGGHLLADGAPAEVVQRYTDLIAHPDAALETV